MNIKNFIGSFKGQALTEFTLIVPLLIVLVGASVDWGMGLFVSHVAQNAAREGVRRASTMQNPGAGSCMIPGCYSEPAGSPLREVADRIPNANLFSGFTITNLGVLDPGGGTCVGITGAPTCGCEVEIRIAGTYNFLFLRLMGFSNLTISRNSKMRWERVPIC